MRSNTRGSGAFRDIAPSDLALCMKGLVGAVLTVKPGREASGGVIRSENVDMSSDKQGERPCRRKSKGSCLKLI